MTATTFDAFSDAQTRLDHGTPQPGDRELADAYDVQLQAAQDDYLRRQDAAEFDYHFPEPADGDLPAGSGDVDLLVFEQLLADGCTVLPAPLAPSVFEVFWAEYGQVAS